MKYALIGENISYSYSALLHGIRGFDYDIVNLKREDLPRFLKDCPYSGFNVTIPFKKEIIPFLGGISPLAKRAGAVNTVVKKGDKYFGYNTDYAGFKGAIERSNIEIKGKNALVLGTGGAAGIVKLVLEDCGAKSVKSVSRTGEINYQNCYDLKDTEVIVNATPVGTFPDLCARPIDVLKFSSLTAVFDLVYNPFNTELVLSAKKAGIKAENGLSMLVIQALESEKIWTGKDYGEGSVKEVLKGLIKSTLNIALTGMPSSGKTTTGRLLAKKLKKPFVDIDEAVYKKTGRTPAEIINAEGEKAFRAIESEAVKEACFLKGAVIALGGGSVLLPQNRDILKKTALVCWIKRDISSLDNGGRPLLQRDGAEKLYRERKAIYAAVSDFCVEKEDIESNAEEIIKKYEDACDKRS